MKIELKAGPRAVGYNLCSVSLERLSDFDWEPAHYGFSGKVCLSILYGLKPFGTASGIAYLPPELESGTYRITHEIEVDGDRYPVASNAFIVLTVL